MLVDDVAVDVEDELDVVALGVGDELELEEVDVRGRSGRMGSPLVVDDDCDVDVAEDALDAGLAGPAGAVASGGAGPPSGTAPASLPLAPEPCASCVADPIPSSKASAARSASEPAK